MYTDMSAYGDDPGKPSYEGTNAMPRQDGRTLHVGVTEGDVAARIITCGTEERARAVASSFDGGVIEREVASARGYLTLTGKCNGVPVSVIATGMGVAMMDFMVREVLAVLPPATGDDARALMVRFGTCGSIHDDVPAGSVVVCSRGSTYVRRELTSVRSQACTLSSQHRMALMSGAGLLGPPPRYLTRRGAGESDAFGPDGLVAGVPPYHVCRVVPADAPLSSALEAELRTVRWLPPLPLRPLLPKAHPLTSCVDDSFPP